MRKEENDIEESTKSSYVHSNWFVSQFDFPLEINELSAVTPKSVAPYYQIRATSLSGTEEQANDLCLYSANQAALRNQQLIQV